MYNCPEHGLSMREYCQVCGREPPLATLRDQFAMAALTGLTTTKAPVVAAGLAYEYADAMMAERSKTGEG